MTTPKRKPLASASSGFVLPSPGAHFHFTPKPTKLQSHEDKADGKPSLQAQRPPKPWDRQPVTRITPKKKRIRKVWKRFLQSARRSSPSSSFLLDAPTPFARGTKRLKLCIDGELNTGKCAFLETRWAPDETRIRERKRPCSKLALTAGEEDHAGHARDETEDSLFQLDLPTAGASSESLEGSPERVNGDILNGRRDAESLPPISSPAPIYISPEASLILAEEDDEETTILQNAPHTSVMIPSSPPSATFPDRDEIDNGNGNGTATTADTTLDNDYDYDNSTQLALLNSPSKTSTSPDTTIQLQIKIPPSLQHPALAKDDAQLLAEFLSQAKAKRAARAAATMALSHGKGSSSSRPWTEVGATADADVGAGGSESDITDATISGAGDSEHKVDRTGYRPQQCHQQQHIDSGNSNATDTLPTDTGTTDNSMLRESQGQGDDTLTIMRHLDVGATPGRPGTYPIINNKAVLSPNKNKARTPLAGMNHANAQKTFTHSSPLRSKRRSGRVKMKLDAGLVREGYLARAAAAGHTGQSSSPREKGTVSEDTKDLVDGVSSKAEKAEKEDADTRPTFSPTPTIGESTPESRENNQQQQQRKQPEQQSPSKPKPKPTTATATGSPRKAKSKTKTKPRSKTKASSKWKAPATTAEEAAAARQLYIKTQKNTQQNKGDAKRVATVLRNMRIEAREGKKRSIEEEEEKTRRLLRDGEAGSEDGDADDDGGGKDGKEQGWEDLADDGDEGENAGPAKRVRFKEEKLVEYEDEREIYEEEEEVVVEVVEEEEEEAEGDRDRDSSPDPIAAANEIGAAGAGPESEPGPGATCRQAQPPTTTTTTETRKSNNNDNNQDAQPPTTNTKPLKPKPASSPLRRRRRKTMRRPQSQPQPLQFGIAAGKLPSNSGSPVNSFSVSPRTKRKASLRGAGAR